MSGRKDLNWLSDDGRASISREELAEYGGRRLVYVRSVVVRDVWDELDEGDDSSLFDIPDDTIVYSVHAANGDRLALVGDRDIAFAAARQQEMNPVSVH